jgi:hypothetical protein
MWCWARRVDHDIVACARSRVVWPATRWTIQTVVVLENQKAVVVGNT